MVSPRECIKKMKNFKWRMESRQKMLWRVDSTVHCVHFLRINSRRESKMNVFVLKLKLKKATKRIFSWGVWGGFGMFKCRVSVNELVGEFVERCKIQTKFPMNFYTCCIIILKQSSIFLRAINSSSPLHQSTQKIPFQQNNWMVYEFVPFTVLSPVIFVAFFSRNNEWDKDLSSDSKTSCAELILLSVWRGKKRN